MANASGKGRWALTAKARASFWAKFEREVDPDWTLAPEERLRLVKLARSEHFRRLRVIPPKGQVAT